MNRKSLYCVVVACLALSACSGEASKKNGEPAPISAGTREPTRSLPKIVAFGDSLTEGYGLAPSQSYPSLLQKKLDDSGYHYEVVNAGVSGDTSAGGVRRIDWALQGDVRVLILELGANDILRGQPIEEMKKNLAQIIDRGKTKGVQVLLAGMEAPTDSGPEYRRAVHEAFPQLARDYKIPLIPFLLSGVAGIDTLNQADGIHPNQRGQEIVAQTVFDSVKPLIDSAEGKSK